MRVLRIGMTYPRDISPGTGLHLYYHSLFSKYEEYIITAKRDGIKPENRFGVSIIEIEHKDIQLGSYSENMVVRLYKSFCKIIGLVSFFCKSKKYIRCIRPDIVHIYTPIPVLCAIYAKRKFGSKIIMSLHGSDALRINKVPILKYLLSIPDAIVTVSDNMEDLLPKSKIKRSIECIGNGVDLDVFFNKNKQRKKQFINVASLRWQKGQEYLLKGFALFLQKYPEYKLIIIGDGELKKDLLALCNKLSIADNVTFLGTIGRSEIAEELNNSKAFVLSSVTEGFPKVVIEAMATGTPVISSDVGNVKKIVSDSGVIFPSKSSNAVCDAMQYIVETNDYQEMSRKAIQYSKQYSWRSNVEKLEAVYDKVMSNGN